MTAGGEGGGDGGEKKRPLERSAALSDMYNEMVERAVWGWRSFTYEAVCAVNPSQVPRYVASLVAELKDGSPRWQA